MAHLSAKELECLKVIARWFSEGKGLQCLGDETCEALGITAEEFSPIILTMQHIGAVDNLRFHEKGVSCFRPTAYSLQLVRELEQQRAAGTPPPDIVEQIQQRARRKPLLAWAIIVGLVLTMVLSILSNVASLIERVAKCWPGIGH